MNAPAIADSDKIVCAVVLTQCVTRVQQHLTHSHLMATTSPSLIVSAAQVELEVACWRMAQALRAYPPKEEIDEQVMMRWTHGLSREVVSTYCFYWYQ